MSESRKLSSFEGLRGIAAFIVVLSHLRQTFYAASIEGLRGDLAFLPGGVARPVRLLVDGMLNGGFAVWLFWIMSGFVLSLQFFLRAHQTPGLRAHDYLEDAGLRRYPRLLVPVLASVLFAYALHAGGAMHNLALAHAQGDGAGTGWLGHWYAFAPSFPGALRGAFWDSFFGFNEATTYNSVLWTMEKEFYGSLFLFAFLGLLGHRRSRFLAYVAFALIDLALGLVWLNAFVAGIALCDVFANRARFSPVRTVLQWPPVRFVRGNAVFAVLAWAVVLMGAGSPNYGGVPYLFFGTAAVGLTLVSTFTQETLSSRVPMFLGKISFGLYLIHFPFLCSFSCWAYLASVGSLGPGKAALAVSAPTCVLSVALGYGLYLAADRPGIRLSRWLSSRIIQPS